jgi:hypothetical protein
MLEVHSKTYNQGILFENYAKFNREITYFEFPEQINQDTLTLENVGWVYGIGINQEIKIQENQKTKDLLNLGAEVSSLLMQPELAIIFKAISLVQDDSPQNAYYAIFPSYENAYLFKKLQPFYILKEDNIIQIGSYTMYTPFEGKVYFGFANPNEGFLGSNSIFIYFNVSIWRRMKVWSYQKEIKFSTTPIYETQIFKEPQINTIKYPVVNQ